MAAPIIPSSAASSSPNDSDALKAATFQRLHPKAYLERFLAAGFRPDGRTKDDWRDISVNVGSISTADGSALVRMGDTTMVCGVKAEIAEPDLDSPTQGFFVPNVDLPAMCSPKFKPGPPAEEAQILSQQLYDILVSAGVIDLTSLCIQPKKSAWVLYVDATCVNYDGNALDAALIAILAALRNTRLPKAKYDEEIDKTTCSRKERVTLSMQATPVSMSFGLFDSSHILADPTAFEEPLLDTTISVTIGSDGSLFSLFQNGLGIPTTAGNDDDALSKCIAIARQRRSLLSKVIDDIS